MSFTCDRLTLIGRVGASTEARLTAGGQYVAVLSLATDRPARSGAAPITDWHRVVCFDRLAEIALEHVTAGRLLFVEGAITYRFWQDPQEQKHNVTEVVARELILLDRPPSTTTASNNRTQTPVRRERPRRCAGQPALTEMVMTRPASSWREPAPALEMVPPPVDLRVERAAEQLRVATDEVECLPFDLSVLNDGGIWVNVDASGFGLLDRRLDWRALGVALPRHGGFAFRPPRHGLVPDRYRLPLLRPADRAHAALHRYSYHFRERLRIARIQVGAVARLAGVRRALPGERGALAQAIDTYAADFEAIRAQAEKTFGRLIADSARRFEATGQPVPAGFEDNLLREMLAALPAPGQLRQRLVLRYRVGVFWLGSEMLGEQRQAAEERRRLEAVEAERQLERTRRAADARLVQEQLWAAQQSLRAKVRAEEEEQQREAVIKERLRQLKLEAARERLQDSLSPIEEGARQLQATVFDAAVTIRDSLRKDRALHGSSARKVRDLAAWFSAMNWTDDRQLEALIGELESLALRKRDPGPIDSVLSDIVALTYSSAQAVFEPSRMAALEL